MDLCIDPESKLSGRNCAMEPWCANKVCVESDWLYQEYQGHSKYHHQLLAASVATVALHCWLQASPLVQVLEFSFVQQDASDCQAYGLVRP